MASKAEEKALQDREWALQHGQPIMDELGNEIPYDRDTGNYFGNQAGDYWGEQAVGGGYASDEKGNILGQWGNNGVPGLDDLANDPNLYLNDEEQAGMRGNPNDPLGYLHSDTIGEYMQRGNEAQDRAVVGQRDAMGNAIDPSRLRMSDRYGSDLTGQVGSTHSRLNEITGNPDLDLSSEFADNYDLTPEQQQDIINKAGRTVGNQTQGELEAMRRQSAAAGIGPMGQQAREARMNRDAGVNSADAMTDARIAASNAAAERMKTKEGMRLGAEQSNAELGAQAEEYSGTQGVNALENIENTRLGSERDISSRELEAATESGRQDIANRQRETATNIGTVEDVRNAEVGAHQTADEKAAARAKAIAENRQNANQTNFGRGITSNQLLSDRYGKVADTRMAQRNKGAEGLTQQQQIRTGNANTERGQQVQTFGTTGQLANQSTQTVGQVQNQPGTAERIFGGILGAASGVASAGLTAGAFEEGGIVTHPTDGILGESGPEMVVPMARNQPMYGEENRRLYDTEKMDPDVRGMGPKLPRYGAEDGGEINDFLSPMGGGRTPGGPIQPPNSNETLDQALLGQMQHAYGSGNPTPVGMPPPAPPPSGDVSQAILRTYGQPPAAAPAQPGAQGLAPVDGGGANQAAARATAGVGAPPRYGAYPPQGTGTRPQAPPTSPVGPPTGTRPQYPPQGAYGAPRPTGMRPQMQQNQPQIVTQPTRARLGQNGPEAVVPLNPNQRSRTRPGMFSGGRYGATA